LPGGVEDAAFKAGFNVIICNTDESQEQEDNYIQLLLQKRVDGILLVPAETHSQSIELLRKHKTPVVIIDRYVENDDVDVVRGDSESGAYQLTKFLIDLGHKRITLLSGPNKVRHRLIACAGTHEQCLIITWTNLSITFLANILRKAARN
jgi:LacI family transcriptional regulator